VRPGAAARQATDGQRHHNQLHGLFPELHHSRVWLALGGGAVVVPSPPPPRKLFSSVILSIHSINQTGWHGNGSNALL
jgi:hypothetical protein